MDEAYGEEERQDRISRELTGRRSIAAVMADGEHVPQMMIADGHARGWHCSAGNAGHDWAIRSVSVNIVGYRHGVRHSSHGLAIPVRKGSAGDTASWNTQTQKQQWIQNQSTHLPGSTAAVVVWNPADAVPEAGVEIKSRLLKRNIALALLDPVYKLAMQAVGLRTSGGQDYHECSVACPRSHERIQRSLALSPKRTSKTDKGPGRTTASCRSPYCLTILAAISGMLCATLILPAMVQSVRPRSADPHDDCPLCFHCLHLHLPCARMRKLTGNPPGQAGST